jgi:LysM repeat protein
MNAPTSPLLPQGTFLEPKNKGRARVRVAVFVVLAVHGIGLLALLMQGCKKDNQSSLTAGSEQTNAPATNPTPAFEPTNVPAAPTNLTPPTPGTTTVSPTPPAETPADYTIAAGDNLSTLARKFHVTVKALLDANPGIEPARLQIGQKIHVPPPAPTAPTANGTTAPGTDTTSGEQMYTVKSGDTLTQIAHENHVTVKAIRTANNLTTDSIKVGQKLKIPKAATPPAGSPDSATSAPPAGVSGH